jgi:hypothetical protein
MTDMERAKELYRLAVTPEQHEAAGNALRAAEGIVSKKSSELQVGDVVLAHGMRCLIDGEVNAVQRPSTTGDDNLRTVYWTQALVLNRDDVPSELVPRSWTACWDRTGKPAADGTHRWTIQGNDLASWQVEQVSA